MGRTGPKQIQIAWRFNSLMAGATGLEPATFGVTGRTKFNEINEGCNLFCG
jgi:hypothetical protein